MPTLSVSVKHMKDHVAIGQQEDTHVLPLDRPEATGGTELGFNGGHLMLLGWGGCFKSVMVASADARDIEVSNIRLAIEGDVVDTPKRFDELRMEVSFDADLAPDEKQKLVDIAAKGCAVTNTLDRATDMTIELVD
ncbi:MAG: OsmC family protein [Nitriliruptorales bacterium]|nr:OsmC family protein [Nitriliruptorales bacterium]